MFDMYSVCQQAGLTIPETCRMPHYLNGSLDFYGTKEFEKLYEYLLPEMPYGTAMGDDGDPDRWILDVLS